MCFNLPFLRQEFLHVDILSELIEIFSHLKMLISLQISFSGIFCTFIKHLRGYKHLETHIGLRINEFRFFDSFRFPSVTEIYSAALKNSKPQPTVVLKVFQAADLNALSVL